MTELNTLIKYQDRVNIIGVPISAVNMEECLEFIDENFNKLSGEYICASNVHTTVMAHENNEYLKAQSESAISLPDGKPLSVVGKKKGFVNMEKVTGTHFMQNIFTDKRFADKRHYFYGTNATTLETVIEKVRKQYPKLNVCGYEASIFRELTDDEAQELANRINLAKANFIWVAIGAPRQELLMNRLKGKVNGIMTGVGGAFNILAGIVEDAPQWMQNAGLEWFYRFVKEPKRLFKRYFVTNCKFMYYVGRDK